MALNEAQQFELQKILESDTFKRATEEVLRMADGSVENLPLDEAAVKMALEKGVRNAFRLLRKVSIPQSQQEPVPRRSITRTTRQ
jgi:hypothetical protein